MSSLFFRTTNPANGLAALGAEVDRMLSDVARPLPGVPRGVAGYGLTPPADVLETEADFSVALDVPGLDPKALSIQVENDTLTVQAERKQPETKRDATAHRSERAYGTFFRSFTLPASVDATRVEATYEVGVLTVVLPKREEAKPRTIQVNVK